MLGRLGRGRAARAWSPPWHAIENLLARAGRAGRRICCGRTGPATWAGSCRATARSTRGSTAGTARSRRWWPRSSPSSSGNSIRSASAAGSPRSTASAVGSAFVVQQVATRSRKLRLVIVDPKARGLGLGARLVEECMRFARSAGYAKITLWTQQHPDRGAHDLREARASRSSPRSRIAASAST